MLKNRNKISNPETAREEAYRYLFPKIGRDFVTREDMESFIENLVDVLFQHGISIDGLKDLYAKDRAEKYKTSLENNQFGTYRDLINLDD